MRTRIGTETLATQQKARGLRRRARPSRRRWRCRIWRVARQSKASSSGLARHGDVRGARFRCGSRTEAARIGGPNGGLPHGSTWHVILDPRKGGAGRVVSKFAGEEGEPGETAPGIEPRRGRPQDVVGPQRREAVKRHRRVGRRYAPRALDRHLRAPLWIEAGPFSIVGSTQKS